jgi:cell division protein FtsZ
MINVDFRDVSTVMKDSGVAIMGSSIADGEGRALKAVEQALASPLLNDNKIQGARYVLLNVNAGTEEPTLDEISEISDFVQMEAGNTANVIMGVGTDEGLEKKISVTIIAAGFDTNPDLGFAANRQPERIVRTLGQQEKPRTVHTLDNKQENNVTENPQRTVHTLAEEPVEEIPVENPKTTFTLGEEHAEKMSTDEPIVSFDSSEEAIEEKPAIEPMVNFTSTEQSIEEKPAEENSMFHLSEEPFEKEPVEQPKTVFTLDDKAVDESTTEPPRTVHTLDQPAVSEQTSDEPQKIVHKLDNSSEEIDSPVTNSRKTIVPNVFGSSDESSDKDNGEDANVPEFKLSTKEPKEDAQTTFEFELKPKQPSQPTNPGMTGGNNDSYGQGNGGTFTPSTPAPSGTGYYSQTQGSSNEEEADPLRTKERVSRLRELSYKSKTYSGVSDMESEPAYKRKQLDLDDVPHSSESSVSRFTLTENEDEEGKATLKPNNPFLHDNVD